MYKIGLINDGDLKAIILKIFAGYLAVCRHLQRTYWLEPAGSHGVWSLDDYQKLVFYFGAAQLHGNPSFAPDCITDKHLMEENAGEYLYFEAIHYINTVSEGFGVDRQTKKGYFYETSPMLYDISGAESWSKICSGMYRMWCNEVLGKFPVVQHIRFGSIFQLNWIPSEDASKREYAHVAPPKMESVEMPSVFSKAPWAQ